MSIPSSPAPETNPTYGQRLQSGLTVFLRALVRLIAILFIFALIGLGIYAAAMYVYPRYIVPVQANSQQLGQLKQQLADQDRQYTDRLGQLQTRLAALESQHSLDSETIAALQTRQNQMDQLQQKGNARLDQLTQIQSDLAALKAQIGQNQQDTQALDERLSASDGPLAGLEREVLLLKGMELLQRSRLSLAQNNAGLARQDLLTLRDLFSSLRPLATTKQVSAVDGFLTRLDLALANLPAYPVLAAQDLEILWEQVGLGLPGDPAELPTPSNAAGAGLGGGSPTPTPTAWFTPTPTPFPVPSLTGSPVVSVTSTAIPTFTPVSSATPTRTPTP